jgi:hypothetical protein
MSGTTPGAAPAASATALVPERQYTQLKKSLLIASFLGLAVWALQCPCAEVFRCHRPYVLSFLGALFIYVFVSTEPKPK